MPLDIILFSFTFAAGIVAFLNLCGVIMLPAYIQIIWKSASIAKWYYDK